MRRFSDHIFVQKCIKFHPQPSRFQKFSRGETPGPLLTGAWNGRGDKGIERFIPLKKREGGEGQGRDERDGRGKGGGGEG